MKKINSAFFSLLAYGSVVTAQTAYVVKKDITLSFKGSSGTNGSAVAWNSDKKVYYAVIAGNATFPLETFSETGKLLYESEAGIDIRGLWYNPKTKKLEGNGQGTNGIFSYNLNASGEPRGAEILYEGQNQPDIQSVGAFDAKKQTVYFLDGDAIVPYKLKGVKKGKSIALINNPVSFDKMNYTTVIFTNRKNEEFGLLHPQRKTVYLFNLKGKYTGKIDFPDNAITHDAFRFSFANGKIWLYDTKTRSWTGYDF